MAGCVAFLVHQATNGEALEQMRVNRDALPMTVRPLTALYPRQPGDPQCACR